MGEGRTDVEDLPLIAEGKPSTSKSNYEIRTDGEINDAFRELGRRVRERGVSMKEPTASKKVAEKKPYAGKYRREDFSLPNGGSYVSVFQRPGEEVLLDINFFDGDNDLEHAKARHKLLGEAILQAKRWSIE